MTQLTFKGNPLHTLGSLPEAGTKAPNFKATKSDLSDISLDQFLGKKVVLNIFLSLDTATCAQSVRQFNDIASKQANVVVLCISADLPFAQSRFCTTEGLKNVIPLSVFRHKQLGELYGVTISDGPLTGLLSRAVVVIDEKGTILYTEHVAEATHEPNYQAALKFL